MNEAQCLIFDLDGTLYEDTDHFDYYAQLLKKLVDPAKQDMFEIDYNRILKGEHPLQIGKVYDAQHDLILTVDPFSNEVDSAVTWEGEEAQVTYESPIKYDFDCMIAIGDGWWLPSSVAKHYGVSPADTQTCYQKTKEYMVSDQFQLTKTPGLKESLRKWKEEQTLVLVTNSEAYDVNNILQRLELEGIFHEVVTSAEKPQRVYDHFERIIEDYALQPHEVVSIGDNFMNEIAPALVLGMKAIFVQPQRVAWKHEDLWTVSSLGEMTNR